MFTALEMVILRPFFRSANDTAKTIASRLKRAGIRGRKSDPNSCALAECLKTVHKGLKVSVVPSRITVGDAEISLLGAPEIRRFINAFDRGEYPSLQK